MSISSKLPSSLQEISKKKPLEPSRPFSKLLSDKQKTLAKDKKIVKEENPIWTPPSCHQPNIQNASLANILSNKLSEITEVPMNTPMTQVPSLEIEELWEKLASATILFNNSQDQETTFVLETNSVFSGTSVTIKEFQTAPKVFNIELVTNSSAALSLIEAHLQQLHGLFKYHEKSFGFSVHRINSGMHAYETDVCQKEKDEEDSQ